MRCGDNGSGVNQYDYFISRWRIWACLKEHVGYDQSLDNQVGDLQVSVAGEYLKREEWKDDMRRLMEKLDSIDEKLDKKADK